jgi:hypothetical protein
MDAPKNVDAWADALLDQHRTAPPGGEHPAANDPLVKLATALSGESPDPLMLDRLQRRRARHATFVKAEAIVTIAGSLLLCAVGYAWLSVF